MLDEGTIPEMRKLKEFVFGAGGWAVASDLASFVFYVLAIVSATRWGASSLSAFVLLAVSVPLFWFGAYSAWEKKALALDSEKARNAKPEIVGEIVHATVRMTGVAIELGKETPNCDLAMKLRITSKTDVDATLKDAHVVVKVKGHKYVGQRLPLGKWDIYQSSAGSGANSEKMNDLISSITYGNPIRYRVASEGWLDFLIEGLDASSNAHIPVHADLTVTLTDDLGDKHIITTKDVVIRPGS